MNGAYVDVVYRTRTLLLIRWDLKLFILFVLMNNSFVSKDVALEVAVVDSKVPNKELGHRHSKS